MSVLDTLSQADRHDARNIAESIEHSGELASWTYAALVDAIELAVREWGRDEAEAMIRRIIERN
jgi:hypothetical protein